MSVDEESTSCYCLLEANRCHLLLEHPGRYALFGAPMNPDAAKRLRLAVFGCPDPSSPLGFSLRVYCVDDTPHAFQVCCPFIQFVAHFVGFPTWKPSNCDAHHRLVDMRPNPAEGFL